MCEGIVEKVKFPNKGIVKVEDSEAVSYTHLRAHET